ncbi:outer membrane beta-barrel protein [Hymenobacter lucidus]|uniref:PorT family protein n=1 Tax=Hymenobacter lucidus TaxID=2880930 RepID=A0ABS8APA8_9BACT|nr:outer membrane beta-barrel protein [Hymenobacter lucidus]MCB2407463.1 PorT family protein [Hymenobacter lucidus]
MKHRLLLLSCLALLSSKSIAQTNFRPGYIVPLSGDTLRGEVDARGAQRNARLSRFRSSPTAPVAEYRATQLRGYGFTNDRVYQAGTVTLADSSYRSPSGEMRADTVQRAAFLEVVVLGPASLLFLRDESSNDHFYLRMAAGPVQELVQSTQRVKVNGNVYQQKNEEFRKTLAASFQACPAVQPGIVSLRLGLNELTKVVRQYNECIGTASVAPASTTRQNRLRIGLVAGGEASRLSLQNTASTPATDIKAKSTVGPVLGVSLQLALAGVNQTIAVRLEALAERQEYAHSTSAVDANGFGPQQEFRFNLASLRVPLLVRYTFPRGQIRPFAQVGFGLSYWLKTQNESRARYLYGATKPEFAAWAPIVKEPRKLEAGLLGGLGLTTARAAGRNVALELRYEQSNGFSDGRAVPVRIGRYFLLLSYDLTK